MTSMTLMGVHYDMPHPWPKGNYFSVLPRWRALQQAYLPWLNRHLKPHPDWRVVNMYAENCSVLCQQQKIRWLEVELIAPAQCAIVDPRIPRSWLSDRPLTMPVSRSRALRLERPELFAVNPDAEALVGTSWTMLESKDPDGFLARLLPGRRVEFQKVDLHCLADKNATPITRTWQLLKEFPPAMPGSATPQAAEPTLTFSVYDLNGEAYDGIAGTLRLEANEMTFTLGSTLESDGESVTSQGYRILGREAWIRWITDLETPSGMP
jgi:hypothetical protein